MDSVDKAVVNQCRSIYKGEKFLVELPRKGLKRNDIFESFKKYQDLSKVNWRKGRASGMNGGVLRNMREWNLFVTTGTVYSDLAEELSSIVTQVYSETAYTNPLHPECFPGINKMEAEVVRMVCNLFNGNEACCGTLTSGGTESIVLAVKAYRDYARHVKGIFKPELVAPVTAHAAFQKACQYFCIKFKSIPVDPVTYQADIKAMRKAISKNTILLVGSACGYPHGIIDDIASIGQVGSVHISGIILNHFYLAWSPIWHSGAHWFMSRWFLSSFSKGCWLSHWSCRLLCCWCDQHFCWHSQIRLCSERIFGDNVFWQEVSQAPVFSADRLAGRNLRLSNHCWKPLRCQHCHLLGIAPVLWLWGLRGCHQENFDHSTLHEEGVI